MIVYRIFSSTFLSFIKTIVSKEFFLLYLVNAQTVRFPGFPGNGTTSNPRMPTFPKQPVTFKTLNNSVRHTTFKPASSGDEILVAKASEDPLAFLTTKSSSGSLLNASSFKKTQSQNNDRK